MAGDLDIEEARPMRLAEARVRWLAELPVAKVLPERTVIVSNEALAHVWRRDVVAARPDLLIGTRFVTSIGAAVAVLELAGTQFTTGEEAVRAARIVAVVGGDVALEGFDAEVLRTGRGWGEALAATLGEIEGGGIEAAALEAHTDPRCRGVARLLGLVDEAAGASWTASRVLREATARLSADGSLWPFAGPCLVEVSGHEDVAMATWLRTIPRATIVAIATQPRRTAYVERVRDRFGELALQQIETPTTNELGLLATYLFSAPEVLAGADRPRSPGNDNTVQLEEHAGLEEELDAAVTWVIGEIDDYRTPLEQIGIVVPHLDPYVALLAARLEVLLPDGVCVLGGIPATATSAGARIATLLRALAGHLHLDVLAELLPILQLSAEDVHMSRADAIAALYELGTVGGSAAHPAGALDWMHRLPVRIARLAAIAESPSSSEDDRGGELRAARRTLAHLQAIAEPLAAIDRVARIVHAGGGLAELWPAVAAVLEAHLRIGVDGRRIVGALETAVQPLATANLVVGTAALGAIETALAAVRLPVGRFGEPRITVAAIGDVGGLTFRSVRVLGLAEGTLPSGVREDPVLPDEVRRKLGPSLALSGDRTIAQLHGLHRAVLGATDRLVMSVARMDPQRRYREPSGALLEAAAALGRSPLDAANMTIPDVAVLRRQAFEPARAELRSIRTRLPVHATGWLDRAVRRREVPRRWATDRILALDRLLAREGARPGPMDGWLDGAFASLPGLTPDQPISASALSRLLECPHRFLYERVLGWRAPPVLADEGNIDALSYGTLFHDVAEAFYGAHGVAFCETPRPLEPWFAIADELADDAFAAFVETYPLAGEGIRGAARRRLRRDVRALLVADARTPKTFVAVEQRFGPLELALGDRTVHVAGFIDRLDRTAAATLVRDLKTGRAKRRKSADDVMPAYDVQLGLYGLVVEASAAALGLPATVEGAYVYPTDPNHAERSFRDDFGKLAELARSWIRTGLALLEAQRFPRTPIAKDCDFCPFQPVCGETAQERAAALLAEQDPALAGFAALKLGKADDGEA